MILVEIIEANEFYEFAMRYNVSGILQTTLTDGADVVLVAVPEEYLFQEVKCAVEK